MKCLLVAAVAAAALARALPRSGQVAVGPAAPLRRLADGELTCAAKVQRKAADLVDEDEAYGWCELKRDLRAQAPWRDDATTYVAALYGSHRWTAATRGYATFVGLTQRIVFAAVSVAGNVRVVYFHWVTPAHPKFTLDPLNRLAVKAHVAAGSANVFLPLVAFFSGPARGRALMWLVAGFELVHCATALRMMPNVFGCKVLMTPGYACCVLVKFGLAFYLVASLIADDAAYKDQAEWLWAYWSAHNTYAWVRIWRAWGAAAWTECARTPPVGPPGSKTYARAVALVEKYLVDTSTPSAADYGADCQGGLVFDLIDADGDGVLDADELVAFLVSFGCGADDVARLFAGLPEAQRDAPTIAHEDFVVYFAPFWRFLFPLYVEELHRRFHGAGGRHAFEALHAATAGAGGGCPFAAALAESGEAGPRRAPRRRGRGLRRRRRRVKQLGLATGADLAHAQGRRRASQWASFTAGSARATVRGRRRGLKCPERGAARLVRPPLLPFPSRRFGF
ncbi:hypothetical protein JL720_3597 [Aureococcus anophagefferens]|nr:hypothetical protein JL720_3597 [Aureococcus anophagefferens]